MIIIYAYINARFTNEVPGRMKLAAFCLQNGFHAPFFINTTEGMELLLEQNRDETILLFSNFPPNSSYPENRRKNPDKLWKADSYERTGRHFSEWTARYRFAAIHIVTGAPESVLSDESIKDYLPDQKISIIRKGKWIKDGGDYENVYATYMIDTIRKYC